MNSIIFSLKRSSFFLLFLPLFAHSYTLDEIKSKVRGAYLYSYSSNGSLVYSTYYGHYYDVVSAFRSNWLAIETNGRSLATPDIDDLAYDTTNSFTSANVTRPVFDISDRYYRVSSFSDIIIIYKFAQSLYLSGYRGSGFSDIVPTTGNYSRFNFNYIICCSDILSSTNSVYRQILLNHLSTIQQSVANIEVNMSGVQSAVEQGNSSLSNINVVASDIRDVVHTNFVSVSNIVESVSMISTNSADILRGVDLLHDDWLASSIDVFLGDDTDAWVNFLNMAVEQGLLSEYDANQYASTLRATDPTRKKSYSIPDAHRRFFAKNSIKGTVVEAQQMRGRYQTFQNWTNQRGVMFGAMDSTWNAVAGDRINSIIGSHVGDWRSELRQQLQDWKTSDERGILNIRQLIEDNFFSDDPRIPDSSNTVPFTVFVTNNVTRPVTNAVSDAERGISSNVVDQSSKTRDLFNEKLFDPNAPGVNVRVVYPIYGEDIRAINVHDTALDAYGQALEGLNDALLGFKGDVNGQWEAWFRRWDSWSPPVSDNIAAIVDILRNWSNGVARLDHELYKDYSNYVHSSSYAMLFDQLASDYPVCYSNLQKFGLSPSSNDGRWWNVVASTLAYDTSMLSYIFEDIVELDNIAREHLEKSPFQFVRDILNDMPSKTQIEGLLDSASNSTSQIDYSFSSFSNSLNQVSNSFISVFMPFRGSFDSPGSEVTFFKLSASKDGKSDHYITIPVGDQLDAWRFIRLGISFGLVAVNLLLFPKYLLMLFTLFIKAYRIGIKFFPDDR